MSDLDFGIEKEIVATSTSTNPFFVGLDGGTVKNLSNKQLYQTYRRVLIVCAKDNIHDDDLEDYGKIFEKDCDISELAKYVSIIYAPLTILKNNSHMHSAIIVSKEKLMDVQNNGSSSFTFNDNEIILLMLDQRESYVRKYVELYKTQKDMDNLISTLIMFDYNNCDNCNIANTRLQQMIQTMLRNSYWTNSYNCQMNYSNVFAGRKFNIEKNHELFKKITETIEKNNASGYTFDLPETKKASKYVDISGCLEADNGYRFYNIPKSVQLQKDTVTALFNSLTNERMIYDLFNIFLLSKEYCHLVINNTELLKNMKPLFDKFLPIYKYIFGYTWLTLYMEECIMKTRITKDCRFVFTIDTAQHLPVFPYCRADPHMNPYIPLLVKSSHLDPEKNCCAFDMIQSYTEYGIDSLENFVKKFNIFSSKKSDRSIFDGLEKNEDGSWKHFVITGSALPMCIEKKNPLFNLVSSQIEDENGQWNRFFNEFNMESDIDIMCNSSSVFEFIDNVQKLYETVVTNIKQFEDADNICIDDMKKIIIYISKDYIEKNIEKFNNSDNKLTTDDIVDDIDNPIHRKVFYDIYLEEKQKKNETQYIENFFYDQWWFTPAKEEEMLVKIADKEIIVDDSDSNIYILDGDAVVCMIGESLKFKIRSPYMDHDLEIFRTRYEDYFSLVGKFHLPCVRGFYDGATVHMLPSMISAIMTHMNIDYKYFATTNDPVEIINKFRTRGFGTFINAEEKKYMAQYIKQSDKWKPMYENNVFVQKPCLDIIYRPGHVWQGFPNEMYQQLDYTYILTVGDLIHQYNRVLPAFGAARPYLQEIINYKTIGSDGKVSPIEPFIIDYAYEKLK